eukprot:TRINITY_DN27633_c0_g1_i1.p1 TRINITY_DN27633_c0_g1~~TRINITY_DN27633_c0_g1_i1.p1  ORF type:complete len:345 (-),score=58.27 TRINITY_DN27633_c0_g1_i1:125-1129(-)
MACASILFSTASLLLLGFLIFLDYHFDSRHLPRTRGLIATLRQHADAAHQDTAALLQASKEPEEVQTHSGSIPCSHRRRAASQSFDANKCRRKDGKRVYIIRHGERVMHGKLASTSCLTSCGKQRGEWLSKVFAAGDPDQDFCQPQAIYAFDYAMSAWSNSSGHPGCQRTMQLVIPLADRIGVKSMYPAGRPALAELCAKLRADGSQSDSTLMLIQDQVAAGAIVDWLNRNASHKTLLASWEHLNVRYLLLALGVSKLDVEKTMALWTDIQFDSVLELHFTQDSRALRWRYQALSYHWQGCPAEITADCEYSACIGRFCTSGEAKQDLREQCRR